MSTPFRLQLPRALYREMIAQALAERPNECCGLLAGRIIPEATGVALGHVSRRFPLVNAAASPTEFLSEPRGMFEAVRAMHEAGLEILAVYHSHPTSAPIPSARDRERNYAPEVMNLILSLTDGSPAVRAWWLQADRHQEAEWDLVEDRVHGP